MDPTPDPALIRGLTQRRISRRDALRYAGMGAGALGLAAFLEACGVNNNTAAGGSTSPSAFDWSAQTLNHKLNFANWPYYIDTSHGTHPTLDTFTQQTGIQVNYKPVINDNQAFYAKIKPQLQAGQSIGWDIIVITNGAQLSELIGNNWLTPLDLSQLPNFTKYASDSIKSPAYDPGNKYSVVWQSGFTGLAFSPKATEALGREPDSLADLWDDRLKGHVGMMSDNTELGSIGLLHLGIEPSTSTSDDWNKAAQVLQQQKDAGIPRGYFDQGYINQLEDDNTWLTQAWSGDVFLANQTGYPELKFIVPKEGVMFWHDNMLIPVGAENPLDALTYMNYAYDPHVAALMANYIWYVTPVPDAKPIVAGLPGGKPVADSPLVFPDQAMYDKTHTYYVYKGTDDLDQWNNTFDPIITG